MNLREIPMFKNLDESEIAYIKSKVEINEISYKKGSHVFSYGDLGTDLYYLIDGSITVYKIDANGKRFIIKNFDKPAVFGEVYAYLSVPFDFSAEVDRDSKILVIRDFRKLFADDTPPGFLLSYIQIISRKCLELSRNNQITAMATLRQKIAQYLILNQSEGVVKIKISREEWADILATTRPSLSRELSNMASDKLIAIDERNIKILDYENLRSLL